jgi:hypothetical protein
MLENIEALSREEYKVEEILAETFLDLDQIAEFLGELGKFKPSHDDKLKALLKLLNTNPVLKQHKVLIFTEYMATARYLRKQLAEAGVQGVDEVDSADKRDRGEVIERFAPYYNESSPAELAARGHAEIRVLISTDVLSEGLNLQDATRLINYDLHWNPVRLMQRIGRVDRRLNPATEKRILAAHPDQKDLRGTVAYWNFLPPDELDNLLRLYRTVSHKTLRISKTFGIEGKKLLTPQDDFEALREFNQAYECTPSATEEMHLEYQRLLEQNPGLEERLNSLPGRVFSGKQHPAPGTRALFFCYRLPAPGIAAHEGREADPTVWSEENGSTAWYPCIVVWQKTQRGAAGTLWAVISNLKTCYAEGVSSHVNRLAIHLPATQFGPGRPRLYAPSTLGRRQKMEKSSARLGDMPGVQFYRGVVTGLNEAFYLTSEDAVERFRNDDASAALLRPAIRGEEVRRFEIHATGLQLVRVPCGVTHSLLAGAERDSIGGDSPRRNRVSEKKAWALFQDAFPAAAQHLARFESITRKRDDQGEFWWELRPCDYYPVFEKPKVVFPQTGKEPRFAMDTTGYDLDQTVYAVAAQDWFVLALLNSRSVEWYIREVSSTVRGGYLRFLTQYLENIPVPNVSAADHDAVAACARKAQKLHGQRRARVESFLRDIGLPSAQLTSRNPLEQPWTLPPAEFTRRTPHPDLKMFTTARDETAALTDQVQEIEREIDARVAALYGLTSEDIKIVEEASP